MRLTHLKLAGFKSFVDPTTIHLHGQRVGVVGPNGCGKSNVMESVRWVLGESSAKEMRADAMDAVIFNGSANRKPISRASVELVFDNSLGSASGEWSQYAEIAVKRVIEREKGSTYYINNTAVRRRDVADLFLGTGLGGRAYAIIGQNTISRIVEAKPEELRIYLEEAAGISKYKERRRETELRLRDTRDNLTRVEDICRELQKQITRLESQAVVAQNYHELQTQLKLAEGQLWLLKKRDAGQAWEKAKTHVEKLVNQLEAQTAQLRKIEAEVEASRQAYYAATEAINVAQAAYYEANAEVSNLENQVKQNTEARERMTLQLQQIAHSMERNALTAQELQQQLQQLEQNLVAATEAEAQSQTALEASKAALPQKEAALREAIGRAQKSLSALNEAKQRIQLDTNHIRFLQQSIDEHQQRLQRLESQLGQISAPNPEQLGAAEQALQQTQQAIAKMETALTALQQEESALRQSIQSHRDTLNQAQRLVNQMDAEIASLQKIQQSLNSEGRLNEWLASKGLKQQARLWEKLNIEPMWNVAFESVLGQRLNALIAKSHDFTQRPPSSLVMVIPSTENPNINKHPRLTPLISVVTQCAPDIRCILEDWLSGIYLLQDSEDTAEAVGHLALGERLVNRQGDIFSAHSVIYHGENSSLHGVIERQQRLESLQTELPTKQAELDKAVYALNEAEKQLQRIQQRLTLDNQQLKSNTQRLHQQQLELSRLQQAQQAALDREKTIKTDITLAKQRLDELQNNRIEKTASLETANAQLAQLEAHREADAVQQQQIEQDYQAARGVVNQAEKSHQECLFNIRLINNNINELNNKINVNHEEKKAFALRQTEAEQMLALTPMETLKVNLEQAINLKQQRENALADARNQAAGQEAALQTQERARLQAEQQLHPMRDELEAKRLQEQEARLHFEQCQSGLQEVGIDEQTLTQDLPEDSKTSILLTKTNELKRKIEALGAVNLAAIQELASERERKSYLDSQMQDLLQASETLEDAIRKIDRETRDKLMNTFNIANTHFGELFKTLFGGGQAKLELMGEEILDTGLQVIAQPPGKKNTTIQLLSGGEKALTAMALVFALFRLNPAPFCLMDEVDAPLDDSNTERFCAMVRNMSEKTQFLFVSHNKITMEMAQQLIGVTMQESGVSRIVDVDIDTAMRMHTESVA